MSLSATDVGQIEFVMVFDPIVLQAGHGRPRYSRDKCYSEISRRYIYLGMLCSVDAWIIFVIVPDFTLR